MTWGQGGNRAYRRARAQVLERDGHQCQLRYPGCVHTATEADHRTNIASIGINRTDVINPDDMQAVCRPCHLIKTRHENLATNPRRHPRRITRPKQPHPGD